MYRMAGSKPAAGQMATKEQMEKEFAFFGEVWAFFKKYYFPRPDNSYWRDLVEESAQINEKYSCPLCHDLLVAVVKELRRRAEQKEGEA